MNKFIAFVILVVIGILAFPVIVALIPMLFYFITVLVIVVAAGVLLRILVDVFESVLRK